ncbi:TLD domain-containing protein 2 [Seminavis robusta]|uniref:Oxidation resistance protein 1 n=1 Tax=Seminavis robusta TaxID=568900 RepID=A0A9N8DXT0_9STRA|nr:TLD domain-containing protein 2 [Seminavis robusta]|eukprot:Sro361_g126520.1 TLD domain-containing protein 2 (833) ;mRNA; f:35005-37503
MPCVCCKKPAPSGEHVAVSSRADSGSAAPKPNRMGDRGFDDDKAALQKWRDQHLPPKQQQHNNHQSPDEASSGSDASYGIDETKQPVKLSPRAVQAWQEKRQERSPPPPMSDPEEDTTPTTTPTATLIKPASTTSGSSSKRKSLKEELRSPYELSSASGSSQSGADSRSQLQLMHILRQIHPNEETTPHRDIIRDEEVSSHIEASPTTTTAATPIMHNPQRSSPTKQPQPQQPRIRNDYDQLDALVQESNTHIQQQQQQHSHNHHHNNATHSPPSSSNNSPRKRPIVSPPQAPPHHYQPKIQRQHDHEGLRDQMIRDVVLQQQQGAPSYDDDDDERLHGQVFLKVNSSPRSSPSHDHNHFISNTEEQEEDTDDYYNNTETGSVSDIFSDPALEDVASSLANDGESRERYILACRLLRTRITQRHPPPIMPMERELLQDLLERFRSSRNGGSAMAFEALSNILAQQQEEEESRSSYPSILDLDGSHDSSRDGVYSVASIREEEEGFNTVLRRRSSSSWRDEKNPKALPQLLEVEHEDDTTTAASRQSAAASPIVRLDGWNNAEREKPNHQQYPFVIMGFDEDTPTASRVLSPAIMEAMRGFLPYSISEDNFWLKFSLVRDGASLRVLLRSIMPCTHTVICVETNDGDVFGSFCSTPWKNNGDAQKWFGTGESFLWKLKQSRYVPEHFAFDASQRMHEMEVYPYTGHDDMVQYCTSTTLAVGGGSWNDAVCPYPGEPTGIGLLLDGDLEGGETNSCATFANPRLTRNNNNKTTVSNEFTIANLEVWTLTPHATIHLAEQLERQKYFIKEHTLETVPSSSPTRSSPMASPRGGRR